MKNATARTMNYEEVRSLCPDDLVQDDAQLRNMRAELYSALEEDVKSLRYIKAWVRMKKNSAK